MPLSGAEPCERRVERGIRVLHVLRDLSYGTASTVAEIAPQLEQQGALVNIVALSDGRLDVTSTRKMLDKMGVAFQEIPIRSIRRWMRPKSLFRMGDLARVAKKLGDLEADIIHCHELLSLGASLLSRHRGRVVATFHGMPNRGSLSQRCYRAAMGLADTVITLKDADARAIHRWSKSQQICLARNGLNVSLWEQRLAKSKTLRGVLGIPGDAFVVGVIGRLSKEKGIEPFLAAATCSGWLTRADVHIVVAGNGQEEDRFKRLSEQQGLAGRVHFLGYRSDIENLYCTLDVLAVPSNTESQPMVVLEAMACRVPVVAFSVGAIPEMLMDGAGIEVPWGDFDALIDALDSLRMSCVKQASLVENAYKRVRGKYEASEVARKLMQEVYLPLISESRL